MKCGKNKETKKIKKREVERDLGKKKREEKEEQKSVKGKQRRRNQRKKIGT